MTEEDEAFEDLAKRQGDWGMQGSRKHQILRYAENVENKGTSMTDDFNKWWDEDDLTTEGNNFVYGTPAYWAWEGWCAGAKAEREACAKLCEQSAQNYYPVIPEASGACTHLAAAIRARGEQA